MGTPWLLWPLLLLWGGTMYGFYTQGIALLGESYPRAELADANAVFRRRVLRRRHRGSEPRRAWRWTTGPPWIAGFPELRAAAARSRPAAWVRKLA